MYPTPCFVQLRAFHGPARGSETVKSLRKRLIWILLAVVCLPVLASGIWYGRQVRQQHLDHALIEAIKKNDTPTAVALLDQGADANATDKPVTPVTLISVLTDFWSKIKGKKTHKERYTSALILPYYALEKVAGTEEVYLKPLPPDNPRLVQSLLEHGA